MGYLTTGPDSSNEIPRRSSHPYAEENEFVDVACLAINGLVKRCAGCERFARHKYLENNLCPDCRKESDAIS
jgi:hypothetical protein